uniref:FBA_2 domain-containing protein n=2 Tax=Caenorhabditis tropicalis TaxID=1561998 RepID=A0A1I7SZJ7_9PELO
MGSAGSVSRGPIRTLVLGCMSSGKTSFMRQMVKNHTKFVVMKREYYLYCVQLNILVIYRELRKVCNNLEVLIPDEQLEAFNTIDEYRHKEKFPDKIKDCIKLLKDSQLFDLCRMRQRILPLPQNYNYLISRADDFMNDSFVPTENDIMMSYSQTAGLYREEVTCQGFKFDLLEMPGHHIWRERWTQHFDDPNLVVFVIDLSELCDSAFYDKGHLENKTVSVFSSLVNNPLLAKVYWLLIFNKIDTFNDHSAGFDFKKLASHLDTGDSAKSFYRSQFTTKLPKGKFFAHMVSLVNFKESQTILTDMFRRIGRMHRERPNLM